MMRRLFAFLLLFTLGAAAPAPSRDWSRQVAESPAGWTFGKAGAPLLTEYASFGCPTCGRFAAASGPALTAAVKAGKLRFSYRPFLIFPQDRAASALTRCVPAPRRFAFIKALLAGQSDIKAKLAAADADESVRARLTAAEFEGPASHAVAIADAAGLLELAAAHGLGKVPASACLADEKQHRWVSEADLEARVAGVAHTPTYFWKGAELPASLTPEQLVALLPR
jgi:protein-disulfide isomerase